MWKNFIHFSTSKPFSNLKFKLVICPMILLNLSYERHIWSYLKRVNSAYLLSQQFFMRLEFVLLMWLLCNWKILATQVNVCFLKCLWKKYTNGYRDKHCLLCLSVIGYSNHENRKIQQKKRYIHCNSKHLLLFFSNIHMDTVIGNLHIALKPILDTF